MKRRTFLTRTAALGAALLTQRTALAGAYPERPVRIVVPYSAGGSIDIIARVFAAQMSKSDASRFLVDNRTGASGNIGTRIVAQARPDGYTLLVAPDNVFTVNPHLFSDMGFNPLEDFVPIWQVARLVLVFAVNTSLPIHTIPELIEYARAHPGALGFATAGDGTPHHLALKLFEKMSKTEFVNVPYKGGAPAISDAAAGQVPLVVGGLSVIQPFVESGRLRVLAVTQSMRSPQNENIPAVSEFLPGFDVSSWIGLFAPSKTPKDIVALLAEQARSAAATPEMRAIMATNGIDPIEKQPDNFRSRIQSEYEANGRLIASANIATGR